MKKVVIGNSNQPVQAVFSTLSPGDMFIFVVRHQKFVCVKTTKNEFRGLDTWAHFLLPEGKFLDEVFGESARMHKADVKVAANFVFTCAEYEV